MTEEPIQQASGPVFDDGKAPDAMRTIGEVARAFGIGQHVLRYWEQQFPMLRPLKRSGGRRYYRPADVALVARIDTLINREGYTLKGARQVMEAGPKLELARVERRPAAGAGPASGEAAELVGKLRALRARLAEAVDAA